MDLKLRSLFLLGFVFLVRSQDCPAIGAIEECPAWSKSQWIEFPDDLSCMSLGGQACPSSFPFGWQGLPVPQQSCLDLRGQGIEASFTSAINILKDYYAFAHWKRINFQSIHDDLLPLVKMAASLNSIELYLEAIYTLMARIPDGHVEVDKLCANEVVGDHEAALTKKHVGGSFGFAAAETNDGKFIVTYVVPGSDADSLGLKAGGEIIARGTPSKPMHDWFASVDGSSQPMHVWSNLPAFNKPRNPTQVDSIRRAKVRTAFRAPVGTQEFFEFLQEGQHMPVEITSYDDGYADIKAMVMRGTKNTEQEGSVSVRTLPSGYGYIGITEVSPESWPKVEEAFQSLANTSGLILDFRNNEGGDDSLAAKFSSYFSGAKKGFYENMGFRNKYLETNEKARKMIGWSNLFNPDITAVPKAVRELGLMLGWYPYAGFMEQDAVPWAYKGKVVCLINENVISSGEGISRACDRLDKTRSHVAGFTSTSGSFGMAGGKIALPLPGGGGILFGFPYAQSVDANGIVQLDTPASLSGGGVHPDWDGLLPSSAANLIAYANGLMGQGGDVELEHAEHLLQKLGANQPHGYHQLYLKNDDEAPITSATSRSSVTLALTMLLPVTAVVSCIIGFKLGKSRVVLTRDVNAESSTLMEHMDEDGAAELASAA